MLPAPFYSEIPADLGDDTAWYGAQARGPSPALDAPLDRHPDPYTDRHLDRHPRNSARLQKALKATRVAATSLISTLRSPIWGYSTWS